MIEVGDTVKYSKRFLVMSAGECDIDWHKYTGTVTEIVPVYNLATRYKIDWGFYTSTLVSHLVEKVEQDGHA